MRQTEDFKIWVDPQALASLVAHWSEQRRVERLEAELAEARALIDALKERAGACLCRATIEPCVVCGTRLAVVPGLERDAAYFKCYYCDHHPSLPGQSLDACPRCATRPGADI